MDDPLAGLALRVKLDPGVDPVRTRLGVGGRVATLAELYARTEGIDPAGQQPVGSGDE